MKKYFLIIFILCFFAPSSLLADYVDDKLPADTSTQIKQGARQIIQLGVKKRHVVKVTNRMLEADFKKDEILSAYNVLIRAKKQQLPEDPIMDKLNEGIAKDVQPDKIILAMKKVRARYETASTYAKILAVDEDHIETMTKEIAECMAAGIDANDIHKVAEALREKAKDMRRSSADALSKRSVRIMKTMARSGVESQDALSVVESAFESGYDAKDMEGLENSFRLNVRWTSSASDLAKAYAKVIKDGAKFTDTEFYDPWTTSFGSQIPGGGIRPGGPGGVLLGVPGGGIPPGAPTGSPPVGGVPSGGAPGGAPPPPAASGK